MTLTDDLLSLAEAGSNLTKTMMLSEVLHPKWDRPHPKWQSFVPCTLRTAWTSLSLEARLAVYITAYNAFMASELD